MRLFHVSKGGATISTFDAFTHFGTKAAALERSRSIVFKEIEPVFYEVEFSTEKPLRISDLFSATRSNNHGLFTLVDHLHYDEKVLSAEDRDAVFAAATENNTSAGLLELSRAIQRLGFDSIVYRNQFEGVGFDSFISIDQDQVKVLSTLDSQEITERTVSPPARSMRLGA